MMMLTETQARLASERRERLQRLNRGPIDPPKVAAIVPPIPPLQPSETISAADPIELPPVNQWLVRREPSGRPMIREIQIVTASYFDVTLGDILSARRTSSVVRPRQVAMYLSKTLTLHSLPEIGRRFGDRDHTTILHAVRKIDGMIGAGDKIADDVAAIRSRLGRCA